MSRRCSRASPAWKWSEAASGEQWIRGYFDQAIAEREKATAGHRD